MFKWLYNILFAVITLSFFISATEMNFRELQNSFFDEYDTYVKTEQASVSHATIMQPENISYDLLYNIRNRYNIVQGQAAHIKYLPANYHNPQSSKLFLRNSVWLI